MMTARGTLRLSCRCAALIAAFILVHLAMVVLAGPINEVRSMITGWYRLPLPRRSAEIGDDANKPEALP